MTVRLTMLSMMLSIASASTCPTINTLGQLNLTEWTAKSWYIQQQQVTEYLQRNTFYCVTATYNQEGATVPGFKGPAGLPVGVQLIARSRHDTRLLAHAAWLEAQLAQRH